MKTFFIIFPTLGVKNISSYKPFIKLEIINT